MKTNDETWKGTIQRLTTSGMICKRVGPLCSTILGNDKMITLGVLGNKWYFETMGSLGYTAPLEDDPVTICHDCLHSLEFKMFAIPDNLVSKYNLKKLTDNEFAAVDASIEVDEDEDGQNR